MRKFESGATRDSDEGKLDYEGFISPMVLRRYALYMHRHRKQADGEVRDSDNWQKGIPKEQYMKSLIRHTVDLWWEYRMGWGEEVSQRIDELCCAVMFNVMGYLHERLAGRYKNVRTANDVEIKKTEG